MDGCHGFNTVDNISSHIYIGFFGNDHISVHFRRSTVYVLLVIDVNNVDKTFDSGETDLADEIVGAETGCASVIGDNIATDD